MYGITEISVVALRKEPSEQSEMLSQLLFGDTFQILEKTKKWINIKLTTDQYEGWINAESITELNEEEFISTNKKDHYITKNLFSDILKDNTNELIKVPFGSTLPNFDKTTKSFQIKNTIYHLQDSLSDNIPIEEQCSQFLNSPYLWGGKNPFGIDCSGFTQIIYKTLNINIPRDASEQVNYGKTINFISDTKTGDLAFFDNEEGIITHVGIVLGENTIIHASVKVRIDRLDQQGIYNNELNKYTHKLRVIKRLIE